MTPMPTPPATALPATPIKAGPQRFDRAFVVIDHDGTEVRVRWRLNRRAHWRCDRCGSMAVTQCAHTHAAALALAADLLGLVIHPSLTTRPAKEETP